MAQISQHYRTAFVTGASTGLGRAFAEMLLAEDVRVWGTARDTARLEPLAGNTAFRAVALDLEKPDEAAAAFECAAGEAGGFDLVINNAGYGVFAPFDAVGYTVWKKQLDAMLVTTARLAHEALRGMQLANRGCLVNVASLAVDFPLPYMTGYNIAKAGLSALSESLMQETRGSGVVVIDLRPGDFRTGFNEAMRPAAGGSTADPRLMKAWTALEKNLNQAPPPSVAAAGLRRAILRRKSGTVRCGSFFQAQLAPFFMRFVPATFRRQLTSSYYS